MDQLELKKQAEELQQILNKQVELLKRDSENWLKLGGLVLAGGVLTAGVIKSLKGKKKKKRSKIEANGLSQQAYYAPPPPPKKRKSSFMSKVGKRLLMAGFAFLKVKLMDELGKIIDPPNAK